MLDELRAIRALLIFAHGDLRLPTAATVTMYDACLSGYGVGQSVWKIKEIDAAINHDERWRFREQFEGETHRTRAIRELEEQKALFRCADPLSDSITVRNPSVSMRALSENPLFPNIGAHLLEEKDWKPLFAAPLMFSQPVHLCEARGALASVKHRSRDLQYHNTRILVLGDNMSVTLALSKGRCSSFPLLKLQRRIAAELCASNICAHFRWVPSEANVMDRLSRLWEGARLRALRDGLRDAASSASTAACASGKPPSVGAAAGLGLSPHPEETPSCVRDVRGPAGDPTFDESSADP